MVGFRREISRYVCSRGPTIGHSVTCCCLKFNICTQFAVFVMCGGAALAGLTDITFNVVGYFWVLVCFRALHYRHFWMDRTLWTAGP